MEAFMDDWAMAEDLDDAGRYARRRLRSRFRSIDHESQKSFISMHPERFSSIFPEKFRNMHPEIKRLLGESSEDDMDSRNSSSSSRSSSIKPVDTDSSEDDMDPFQGKAKAKAKAEAKFKAIECQSSKPRQSNGKAYQAKHSGRDRSRSPKACDQHVDIQTIASNSKPIDVHTVARPQPSSQSLDVNTVSSTKSHDAANPLSGPQSCKVEFKSFPKAWHVEMGNLLGGKIRGMALEFGPLAKGYSFTYNPVDRVAHVTFAEAAAAAAMVKALNGQDNRSEKEKQHAGGPPRARDMFQLRLV